MGRRILVSRRDSAVMSVYPPQLGRGEIVCEGVAAPFTAASYSTAAGVDGNAYVVLPRRGDILVSLESNHFSPAFTPALSPESVYYSGDSANNAAGPALPEEPAGHQLTSSADQVSSPAPAQAARARQASANGALSREKRLLGAGAVQAVPKKAKGQVRSVVCSLLGHEGLFSQAIPLPLPFAEVHDRGNLPQAADDVPEGLPGEGWPREGQIVLLQGAPGAGEGC